MIDTDHMKQRLESRRAALERRLQMIDDKLDQPHTADWEDAAIEHEEDEALESLGRTGLQEIEAIDAALARIAAGDYGACVTCGAEISGERLETLPATPFCRNCAA
ncbi:TraR/DksA family transcriptional regulator [Alphaproteobacteria bacterium GH1-50]|uniref:TraR/DksA family transcriptional regulator n=1 Tax=Kangsaoukella pontilimi TaxID=2691042 RepID=A0A7C9IEQ1_9RHOB|nr:TraR/DksA C4-type zinc finger protein [Kangsaoukella pontilimi]MXQ06944.1 TraR/DksA family transcriptional regulator [Kangsaoukella pontilimi]